MRDQFANPARESIGRIRRNLAMMASWVSSLVVVLAIAAQAEAVMPGSVLRMRGGNAAPRKLNIHVGCS